MPICTSARGIMRLLLLLWPLWPWCVGGEDHTRRLGHLGRAMTIFVSVAERQAIVALALLLFTHKFPGTLRRIVVCWGHDGVSC